MKKRSGHPNLKPPKRSEIFIRAELEQMCRTVEIQRRNISTLKQEIDRLRAENQKLKGMLNELKQGKEKRSKPKPVQKERKKQPFSKG